MQICLSFLQVLQEFIEHDADVNATNRHGETPLHQAASRGRTLNVTTLLAANAKVDVANKCVRAATPSHLPDGMRAVDSEKQAYIVP